MLRSERQYDLSNEFLNDYLLSPATYFQLAFAASALASAAAALPKSDPLNNDVKHAVTAAIL